MRFRLQYRDGGRWRYVQGADSGWRPLSRARGLPVELGWTFGVTPQSARVAFRGVVRFRWLRDGAVVLHRLRTTEAGHPATVGADPDGYSAATCSIG
jgi:hypothetical protein